jgi:hypothetical protein
MSQGHDPMPTTTTIRKSRRTRQRRNQPVLIAATTAENSSHQGEKLTIDTATNIKQEIETSTTSEPLPEKQAQHLSPLPKFFSRVDKSEQKEEEVAKARLARANHNPDRPASTIKTKTETKQQSKTTEHREPLFKIRHFIGMTIYLFGAQLILPYEFALAHQLGIDHPIYTLRIFNNSIALSSAVFLNIATLILLLYILVKLDFLPNTASAKLRAEQKAREQRTNRQHATPTVKNAPPPMKLGIKGQDDDLYRAYRANQRREKKR